ncbi:MAG: flagellar assembly protein A [Lachnospirales bacterium]
MQALLVNAQVKSIDFNAIFEAVNCDLLEFSVKVSDEKSEIDMTITYRDNNLKAYLRLSKPFMEICHDAKVTIKKYILDAGIKFGIKEREIDLIVKSAEYGKGYLIAEGRKPRNSIDRYIEYKFDTNLKSLDPKVLEDGSVDYVNLNLIKQVEKGTVLVKGHEATLGTMGKNVLGTDIPCKDGKLMPKMPTGKGVKLIKEENVIIARKQDK